MRTPMTSGRGTERQETLERRERRGEATGKNATHAAIPATTSKQGDRRDSSVYLMMATCLQPSSDMALPTCTKRLRGRRKDHEAKEAAGVRKSRWPDVYKARMQSIVARRIADRPTDAGRLKTTSMRLQQSRPNLTMAGETRSSMPAMTAGIHGG